MELRFKIGPVVVAITAEDDPWDLWQKTPYGLFQHPEDIPPDLTIEIRKGPPPPLSKEAVLIGGLDSQWRFFSESDSFRLEMLDQVHFRPRIVARITPSWDRLDFYQTHLPYLAKRTKDTWAVAEAMNSVVQWWLVAWASLAGRGMLLHASAVSWLKQGLVFSAPSGGGKTTMAHLWETEPQATVLNDERILIWRDEKGWKVSGTPWPGMLGKASPITAPISRLFVLKKGMLNRSGFLPSTLLLSRLLQETFLPVWDFLKTEKLLTMSASLVKEVGGFELEFAKDLSVIEYIKELLVPQPSVLTATETS